MPIHVGCFPDVGKVLLYDDEKKETTILSIERVYLHEIKKVPKMYTAMKSKINGELGCACFGLNYEYGNEIRKKIIEEGRKCGFKNIEIIDRMTANYLYAMSHISYKPMNGDVIWIYKGNVIDVWQIVDQKAKYMGQWKPNHDEMNAEFVENPDCKEGPDIFICKDFRNNAFMNKTLERNGLKLSKKCQAFKCDEGVFIAEGSLLKARITAGDLNLAHLDVYNFLTHKTTIKKGYDKIICFEKNLQLPIKHSQKIIKKSYQSEIIFGLEIFNIDSLPNDTEVYLTFEIDENRIYYVDFENIEKIPTNSKYFDRNEVPVKNMKTMMLDNRDKFYTGNYIYAIPKKEYLMKSNFQVIGIDLGTSRCCAAVNRKNGITTVPLDNTGERLLPSYVAYDEENVKCGKVVVNRLRQFSKSTIFDSKRIIGRKFNDIEIDENWQFTVSNCNNNVQIEVNAFNGKRKITAEEVAADLLKHIKKKSEDLQGTNITKIVITVPAAFTEAQKAATIKAAKLADWNETLLLPEPVAAAFAYFVDSATIDNSNVLLFDLGGGTLDVCIFKTENNQIKILSNTGDTKLGGRNFDTVLINYFKNLMNTKYGISMLKDKKYKLMLECQKIKEDLSSVLDSSLDIDEYDTTQQGIISISREEFEKMAQALINKVKNTIQSALYSSNLNSNAINKVLLVGGGSRMPMIKQLLFHMFPKAEHCCEEHPDEVVAIGAAYYAHSIFSK